jgi:hypothetical protein
MSLNKIEHKAHLKGKHGGKMLKITVNQLEKHKILLERFSNKGPTLKDNYVLVDHDEATSIADWYGQYNPMFICIMPDGSSHSYSYSQYGNETFNSI